MFGGSTYASLRIWDIAAISITFVILSCYWLLFTVHMDVIVILMTKI
jgi:hypothetical protein